MSGNEEVAVRELQYSESPRTKKKMKIKYAVITHNVWWEVLQTKESIGTNAIACPPDITAG